MKVRSKFDEREGDLKADQIHGSGQYLIKGADEVKQPDGTFSWELLVWSGIATGPDSGTIQITCPLFLSALTLAMTYTGDPLMPFPVPTDLDSR